MKDDGNPAAGPEDAAILLEAALHQALIFGQSLLLKAIDDGFRRSVGQHAVPGLDQEVQIGVVDVLAERRIGEDIVDGVVGNAE